MQQNLDQTPQSSTANALHADIISVLRQAESINVMNPFSAYVRLRSVSKLQRELTTRLDQLHDQYRHSLSASVCGPGFAPGIQITRVAGEGLSSLLQVERAWHDLVSAIDQKHAYAFGFFSLYVALLSLTATVILGIAGLRCAR